MRLQPIFIGLAAGVAAALLFLAPIGASLLAFPLFLLTGLPVAIATLGWGVAGGAAATLTATAIIGVILPILPPAVIFLALFALPVLWVGRFAGMWRETGNGAVGDREWYPLGRLLLQAASAAAIGALAVGLILGYDPTFIATAAGEALTEALTDLQPGQVPPTPESVDAFVAIYVAILPFTLALFVVVATVVNLWLGAYVARSSGRFARPRERLWTAVLPNQALVAFGIATLAAFVLPGPLGQLAGVVAGAFGGAVILTGLAVIHAVTIGLGGRGFLLGIMYVLIVISGLPLVLVLLVGAAEPFIQFRARRFPAGAPPT